MVLHFASTFENANVLLDRAELFSLLLKLLIVGFALKPALLDFARELSHAICGLLVPSLVLGLPLLEVRDLLFFPGQFDLKVGNRALDFIDLFLEHGTSLAFLILLKLLSVLSGHGLQLLG